MGATLPIRFFKLLAALLVLASADSYSDEPVVERSASEVRQVFKAVVDAQLRNASDEEIADLEDADNIMVLGAALPHPEHGKAEVLAGIRNWHKVRDASGHQICTHQLMEPMVASETIFSGFMLVTCKAQPPSTAKDTQARLLLTMQKLPQGWRIVHRNVGFWAVLRRLQMLSIDFRRALSGLALLAAGPLLSAAASAAEPTVVERSTAEVIQMFKDVEEAQAHGANVQQIAAMEDAENIMVVGEGVPVTQHGKSGGNLRACFAGGKYATLPGRNSVRMNWSDRW